VQNTLQSMRRSAVVRVIPTQGGYLVEVAVTKELEDVLITTKGSTGTATFQHATTLDRGEDTLTSNNTTKGWINQGRDPILEYQMLAELQARLQEAGAAQGRPLW